MEKLFTHLQVQARSHPSNPVLQRILSHLRYLLNGVRADSPNVRGLFEDLQRDLDILATEGLWEPSKQDEDSLHDLERRLGLSRAHTDVSFTDRLDDDRPSSTRFSPQASPSQTGHLPSPSSPGHSSQRRDISIVQPPPLSAPLLPVSTLAPTVLPVELVEALNHTFFLHLLATDPERVLPPGKSLLSMMSTPRTNLQSQDGDLPKLEERVKDVVHKAFWKEVSIRQRSTISG